MKKNKKKNKQFYRTARWDKLDNTANLFPVIATKTSSNVFRISVELTQMVQPELLQKALNQVLPYFDMMRVRMKDGFFWYYFEENPNPAPDVVAEEDLPCRFINPLLNREYLFRVLYYENRISLEVFHVLTDGNGALLFLKEILYQYLRMVHPQLAPSTMHLQEETSVNREDSYVKNYKKPAKSIYKTQKALVLKGETFPKGSFGIVHGFLHLPDVKRVAKSYGVTINQYLLGVLAWSVYTDYLGRKTCTQPFSVCVPVNLRPYFDSITTKNFFATVSATFVADREDYSFEEVLAQVTESLEQQISKENLEQILAYNVANEKNKLIRMVPLFIKNMVMRSVYKKNAGANSGCVTNLGAIHIAQPYDAYVERVHVLLSMSPKQNLKAGVISYKDTLAFTFSSILRDTGIQKTFFRTLSEAGIAVSVKSNGVYYESMQSL